MTLALSVGLLLFGGVYLLLRKEMFRVVMGFTLLSHAVNLLLLAAGGSAWRDEPFGTHTNTDNAADPLPQAFVLTAIVISFSLSIVLLVSAVVRREDDVIADHVGEEGLPAVNRMDLVPEDAPEAASASTPDHTQQKGE